MKKIIVNLVILGSLGSSVFAMEDGYKNILNDWVARKGSSAVSKVSNFFGLKMDSVESRAAFKWLLDTATGDNFSAHIKDIEEARKYGSISKITLNILKSKNLGNLPNNIKASMESDWLDKIKKDKKVFSFNAYIDNMISAASANNISTKKHLTNLFGTKSQKFWYKFKY